MKGRIKSVLSYKKPAFWVVTIAVIACIVTTICFLTNPVERSSQLKGSVPESKAGGVDGTTNIEGMVYEYAYLTDDDTAYLALVPETEKCSFSLSLLSSYFPYGIYEESNNYVVMKTDDNKNTYTFRREKNDLIFVANQSSAMPSYKYSSDSDAKVCIPDGAIFKFQHSLKMYIDKISADIDRDGVKETCVLDYGPTSGLFTFTFSVFDDDALEYFNIFNSDAYALSFIKQGEELKVQGITQGDNSQIILFNISLKDENVVLSHDGEQLAYWGEQGVNSKYAEFDAVLDDNDTAKKTVSEYYGLNTAKGLELYVWKMSADTYRFGLMSGTNRIKTTEEITALPFATLEEMKKILATYDIPKSDVAIMPIQHPLSSYYWEDKDNDVKNIREMIGWEAFPLQ